MPSFGAVRPPPSSSRHTGAVLYQDGKPIAFESKKLDYAQCHYTVQEKELFVIIHALKSWHHYLYENCFVVTTDDESTNKTLKFVRYDG